MPPEFRHGLLAGLGISLWAVISLALGSLHHMADVAGGTFNGSYAFLVPLLGIGMALCQRRAINGGSLTFGRGLGSGIVVSVIGAVTSGVCFFIYTQFLNPGWRERVWAVKRVAWEQAGVTPAEISMGDALVRGASSPMSSLTHGLITSLVVWLGIAVMMAALLRRSR